MNRDCLFSLPVYEIADFFFPFESLRAAACFLTILDLSPWELAIVLNLEFGVKMDGKNLKNEKFEEEQIFRSELIEI